MKTVVIIENEVVELEILVDLFTRWQREINIMTAREEEAAISIMSKQQVDLVICDLAIPADNNLKKFAQITHSFPCVPCIALSADTNTKKEEVLRHGASHYLEKPIDTSLLLQHAKDLLDIGTSGTIKGIPIHSFLQILESEEKTCTLQINRAHDMGLLYIKKGLLIGAETNHLMGEEAAYVILAWQEAVIQIRFFNNQRKRQINKPLISIIIEAARLKEEREKKLTQTPLGKKHQLPLRHLPTMGKRIPLEIGSRMKLEFPHLSTLFETTMIGMSQDDFLILTNPQPFSDIEKIVCDNQRLLIKYIHKGKVWMFKSQLLTTIASPKQLIFIEYPGVIHFHELRKNKRLSIFVPCTFHLHAHDALYGVLIDLSSSGGLCHIKRKKDTQLPTFHLNSQVILHCLLPGIKEEQKIDGIIRNIEANDDGTEIGVEFTNISSHITDIINQYLYSIEEGVCC